MRTTNVILIKAAQAPVVGAQCLGYYCVLRYTMKPNARIFLLFFFLLNLLQAAATQLTGDEALYWMYWKNLDFGYRDHPPAIGVLIGIGYSLFKNELGVRLLVVVANACTLWLTWRLVKPATWWHFAILVLSIPVLTLYGFIATPDVPLLLSVALYFTTWKYFLEDQSLKHTLLLALCMAALVWSKYHGVLVIIFLLLPVRRLWLNRYFWIAAAMGITLYVPHLLWQAFNDLPTVKFHITERNSDAWEMKHVLGYAGGQLLVFNPVVACLVIYFMIRTRARDDFERSMRWLICGLWLLFFFNSFRGRVEPHWTAPLALAIIYVICRQWQTRKVSNPLKWGLGFFVMVIFFVRVAVAYDIIPQLKRDFHRGEPKMLALKKIAGDLPVCFMNSYQDPSLYMFYAGGEAHSINNMDGGRNQYDYWHHNESIDHRPFLFSASFDANGFEKVASDGFDFVVKRYDNLPVLHGLTIWTDEWLHHLKTGERAHIPAYLINHNSYKIAFNDPDHPITWRAVMNHKKPAEAQMEMVIEGMPAEIEPGDSVRIAVDFTVPDRPGKNLMYFAAQVDELPATYQSNRMRIMIEK